MDAWAAQSESTSSLLLTWDVSVDSRYESFYNDLMPIVLSTKRCHASPHPPEHLWGSKGVILQTLSLPGSHIPSAVCGIIVHAAQQCSINLRDVLFAYDFIWRSLYVHTNCLANSEIKICMSVSSSFTLQWPQVSYWGEHSACRKSLGGTLGGQGGEYPSHCRCRMVLTVKSPSPPPVCKVTGSFFHPDENS